MMRIYVVVLLVLCVFGAEAQKKKKSKKPSEQQPVEEAVDVVFEEPVEEVIVLEETTQPLKDLRNENGPFYIYETNTAKDVAIVYQGSGYDNRKYALMKLSSQSILTPFVFESISGHFGQSPYATVSINGKYGTINNKGQIVVPCIYERFSSFFIDDQIYFIGSINGLFGAVNESNEIFVPFEYENLFRIYRMNPFMMAKKGQKYGVIDPISKKVLIPIEFEEIESYGPNLLRVKRDNMYNFLDGSGKQIYSKWYSSLSIYDESIVVARIDGKHGILDLNEKVIVPFKYERVERSHLDGTTSFLVQRDGKSGLINKEGKEIVPCAYDNLRILGSNYALHATQGSLKGLIGKDGSILLPLEYDVLESVDRNIIVKRNGKSGLLDKDLKQLLPLQYDDIQPMMFESGYSTCFIVTRNGKKGVVDSTGKILLEIQHDNFVPNSNGYGTTYKLPLMTIKKGKYGMMDLTGKELVPFIYDQLIPLNSFLVIVGKGKKFGIIEMHNPSTPVLPLEYNFIVYKQGSNLIAYKDGIFQFKVSGNKITPQN